MKKYLILIVYLFYITPIFAQIDLGKPIFRFARGFTAPIYYTDSFLDISAEDTTIKLTLTPETQYRIVFEDEEKYYLKLFDRIKIGKNSENCEFVSYCKTDDPPAESDFLYSIIKTDAKPYHVVFKQGLKWSTLLLPIKFRPETKFDGETYINNFATDIAVGPFFGYIMKMGKYKSQYLQFGAFAGPGIVDVTSSNINETDGGTTNSNQLSFTYGYGVVYQFEKLQIGLIKGKDFIGGAQGKNWAYNNKAWYSFAIGFSFLNEM